MSYAIIGFGKIGQALATAFARSNIEVSVASLPRVDARSAARTALYRSIALVSVWGTRPRVATRHGSIRFQFSIHTREAAISADETSLTVVEHIKDVNVAPIKSPTRHYGSPL